MVNHWWQVTLVRHAARADDLVDPRRRRACFEIEFDFSAHRLRITVEGGEHARDRARAQDRGALLRRGHGALDVAGPRRADLARPGRDRARDPVRRGHRTRLLRPRRGAAVLAPARPGRPRPARRSAARSPARSARCTSSGAGWTWPSPASPAAGAPAPRRRAQLRRLGHGRGLLPRAHQLRLLARRRRGGRLLRVRLPRAPRLRRPRRSSPPRRSTTPTAASSCCPTSTSAPPTIPTPPLLAFLQDHLRSRGRPRRLGPRDARLPAGAGGTAAGIGRVSRQIRATSRFSPRSAEPPPARSPRDRRTRRSARLRVQAPQRPGDGLARRRSGRRRADRCRRRGRRPGVLLRYSATSSTACRADPLAGRLRRLLAVVLGECHRRRDRRVPGPEVLGAELLADRLLDPAVDLVGVRSRPLAALAVGQQVVARLRRASPAPSGPGSRPDRRSRGCSSAPTSTGTRRSPRRSRSGGAGPSSVVSP